MRSSFRNSNYRRMEAISQKRVGIDNTGKFFRSAGR